jgi:linearmycin/streptolysin S transport system permease protein
MPIWTLAKKDLRLLVRDPRALTILLAMPFLFILVLGISLGEGFGRKPLEGLRVSVVNLDRGLPRFFDRPAMLREGMAWFTIPGATGPWQAAAATALAARNSADWYPHEPWGEVVLRDLAQTADISVELITDREEARRLVKSGRRAAVLILGPNFSKRVERTSFLAAGWQETFLITSALPRPGLPTSLAFAAMFDERQDVVPLYFLQGINPYHRDGIKFSELDVEVLRDPTQEAAAAIIDQVAQGTLLRVVLPWMIGRAFGKIGDPEFIDLLTKENILVPVPGLPLRVPLATILRSFTPQDKRALGNSLQNAIQNLFAKYNLTAKNWTALTKSLDTQREGADVSAYREEGHGILKRGAIRYQLLVPSYIVMFAFFLVLTVGWLFVAERRQGTMKRLVAAPLSRGHILAGKMIPCYLMSLFQGFFLLGAGKLVFGMSWGPEPLWLIPVVLTTSLAAMGLAMLVAALARTESQVSIYGTLLVLLLAGLSGTFMGDRALMPEQMQELSRLTPHAWALDAYRQLVASSGPPDLEIVARACLVLTAFGVVTIALAWSALRLD